MINLHEFKRQKYFEDIYDPLNEHPTLWIRQM